MKKLLKVTICFLVFFSSPIYSNAETRTTIQSTSSILSGWKFIGGKWYYYLSSKLVKGWFYENGKWYFLDQNGVMKTGWIFTGGKWYFLDNSGEMKTGWIYTSGKWYLLDSSGAMKTGWVWSGGKWYYLEASGAMKTGWTFVKDKWYYLNSSGAMHTGWLTLGPDSYYLNTDGSMKTGWLYDKNEWYFLNEKTGRMYIGWNRVDGKVYFFTKEGLLTNCFVDGRLIDANGVLVVDANDIAAKYGVKLYYTYTGPDLNKLYTQKYDLVLVGGDDIEYIGAIKGGLVEGQRQHEALLKELALGINAPVSETELNKLVNQAYETGSALTEKIQIYADESYLTIIWEF